MPDLADTTSGLIRGDDGVWRASHVPAVSYPETGADDCFELEDGSFWFQHRNRIILDAVKRVSPPPTTLLDIGGGNGYVARALSSAGYQVALLEPSESGAANAVSRGIDTVICAVFGPGLFAGRRFGIAGLFDVIEHIEDDVAFLRDVRAILSPGGIVVITVPAFQALFSEDDVFAGHFRRYSRGEAANLLSAGGFEPLRTGYFMAPLAPAAFLMHTLPSRLGLRRRQTLAKARREHGHGSKLRWLVEGSLSIEAQLLARGRGMPFGTSCLAIGRVPRP